MRDFLLSSGLENHREHRVHREKRQSSVYSVVDYLCLDSLNQDKLKSLWNGYITFISNYEYSNLRDTIEKMRRCMVPDYSMMV